MVALQFNHGSHRVAAAWKDRQDAVTQRLDHTAVVRFADLADPLRQPGDGLGGLGVAQRLEDAGAARQVSKYNRRVDTHALAVELLWR